LEEFAIGWIPNRMFRKADGSGSSPGYAFGVEGDLVQTFLIENQNPAGTEIK
jgi:hypothetical protein